MSIRTKEIPVGIVGLGLMGCSIATCLLMAGHPMIAVAPISDDMKHAESRIRNHLLKSGEQRLVYEAPEYYLKNLIITEDYSRLKPCKLVIESTIGNEDIKKSVYSKIELEIAEDALMASNTSAIPISILQKLTNRPERFFGLHWEEPSHTTRFLEVICGELSNVEKGEYLYELSYLWGKEPTLVRKDIRGFIGNRIMYAM
jgi:3-hydroxybutyryl-CoA dehydrogenase